MKKKLLRLLQMVTYYSFIGICMQILFINLIFADNSNAQKVKNVNDVRIELDLRDVSLEQTFRKIEAKTEFKFTIDRKDLNPKIRINFNGKASLKEILLNISKEASLRFRQINYNIDVRKIKGKEVNGDLERIEVVNQTRSITGTVTSDDDGEGLPGVNVVEFGTTNGTITDVEGSFSLEVAEGSTLVFSSVGYQTQEVPIGSRSVINVTLSTDIAQLEEVVVVGYGSMQRRKLTGAISSVDMGDLEDRSNQDIGEALRGKVPGVQVVTHNGSPGEQPTIQIRSLNSITAGQTPLLVIDGVPMENMMDLSVVNPQNIESIEILKDASASAIYGSRASAGVVLVTTKGGKAGKLSFNVSYEASMQQLPRKIDMMNAEQYIDFAKRASQNAWVYNVGGDPNAPNTIEARGNPKYTWPQQWDDPNFVANWPSTDWQEATYEDAPMHEVNLTATGGTEKVRYNLSGNFLDQKGIIDNGNRFQRLFLQGKVEADVTDWFRLGVNLNARYTDNHDVPEGWVYAQHGLEMPPIFPVVTEQGYAGGPRTLGADSRYPTTTPGIDTYEGVYFTTNPNPFAWDNDEDNRSSTKTQGTIFTEFTLADGLQFRTTYMMDQSRGDNSFYRAVDRNLPFATFPGDLSRSWDKNIHWYLNNRITYNKSFLQDHEIDFVAGMDVEKTTRLGFNARSSGFENDLTPFLSVAQVPTSNGDSKSITTYRSYFARANYIFRDRYIIKGSVRYDASSRFGTNNRWGSFPSVGLGWIISEEPFMQNISLIDNLKFRASFGLTGNNNFGDYIWIPRLNQGTTAIGGNLNTFFNKGSLPNPDLRWEKTGMFNIGFDLSMLNNRLSLVVDMYQSKTEDLLLNLPISSLTGFTSLLQNVGSIQNRGIELGINTINISKNDLEWNTNFNFALNRGKAIDLGGEEFVEPTGSAGFQVRAYEDGDRLFEYFAWDYIGTYRDAEDIASSPSYPGAEPGDAKYRDVDGDGEITTDDRTILGTMMPDFTWNMTNGFKYKGFDLNVLVTAVVGGKKVNTFKRRTQWWHGGRNLIIDMADAWSEENPDAYRFKPSVDVTAFNTRPSSYWFDDADFIKIQNLTLGYTFKPGSLERLDIAGLRLYLSAERLISFDNFIGYDPEQGRGGGQHFGRGFTHSEYAIPRVLTAGINISL